MTWANHRLLAACAKPERQAEFRSSANRLFPVDPATLNHILIIDRFYVDATRRRHAWPCRVGKPCPCPTMSRICLSSAPGGVDRRLIVLVRGVWRNQAPDPDYSRAPRHNASARAHADRLLLHLFQHQIHHRGQAHAMLQRARPCHRRNSTSSSRSQRRHRCAPLNLTSWDGRRREFGGEQSPKEDGSRVKPIATRAERAGIAHARPTPAKERGGRP